MSSKKGFTLIELLVVIAIIAILAAILFPVFARAREAARQTQCASNIRQLGSALRMFAQDNDEKYPSIWKLYGTTTIKQWWMDQIQPYTKNEGVFACPNDNSLKTSALAGGLPNTLVGRCSYAYRDYYHYRDSEGVEQYNYIPGVSEGGHADVSSIACLRCTRGLLSNTATITTANDAAGSHSYTNYAAAYGKTALSPAGVQPLATNAAGQVLTTATINMLHGDGVNYLYIDGHVSWKVKDAIIQNVKMQLNKTQDGTNGQDGKPTCF